MNEKLANAAQAAVINAPIGRPRDPQPGDEVCANAYTDELRSIYRQHAVVTHVEHRWQVHVRLDNGDERMIPIGKLHRWCNVDEIELARCNAVAAGYRQIDHGWFLVDESSGGRSGFCEQEGQFPLGLVDYYGHSQPPCLECGVPPHRGQRFCLSCDYWLGQLTDRTNAAVVDGVHYRIGNGAGGFRGFGGRTFHLVFEDGRHVTTSDLWFQGEIPMRFRDRLPDDCHFAKASR